MAVRRGSRPFAVGGGRGRGGLRREPAKSYASQHTAHPRKRGAAKLQGLGEKAANRIHPVSSLTESKMMVFVRRQPAARYGIPFSTPAERRGRKAKPEEGCRRLQPMRSPIIRIARGPGSSGCRGYSICFAPHGKSCSAKPEAKGQGAYAVLCPFGCRGSLPPQEGKKPVLLRSAGHSRFKSD